MTVHPTAKNLAKDVARQMWPKRQPRPRKTSTEFPKKVRDLIWARSGGLCEIDACGPVQVFHHRAPRGNGGSSLGWIGRAANGLGLSNRCHDRVEGKLPDSSRVTSYVNGWLVRRNGNTIAADVHVLYRGRLVVLTDAGGEPRPIEGDTK
jgi:hypothetical protein